MVYLSNAFSANMLSSDSMQFIRFRPIGAEEIPTEAMSVIGHADTANIVGGIIGRPVPCNRASVVLTIGDILYVAQYRGPRLPEGATELPEGATLDFIEVTLGGTGCLMQNGRVCPGYHDGACPACTMMGWYMGGEPPKK